MQAIYFARGEVNGGQIPMLTGSSTIGCMSVHVSPGAAGLASGTVLIVCFFPRR